MKKRIKKESLLSEVVQPPEGELYRSVRAIIARARATVYVAANAAMVKAYWNVGREIVEKQGGRSKAKYGDGLIKTLSVKLTAEFGDGYSVGNLFNMRQFYLAFPKFYTVCRELSWSHYRTLMRVENPDARQYYLEECVKSGWSVRSRSGSWSSAASAKQSRRQCCSGEIVTV